MTDIERWTIWKRVGRWDDAILGPDTGTVQGDPGVVIGEGTQVVRASEHKALQDTLREIAEEAEMAEANDYQVDRGWIGRRARAALETPKETR